MNLSKRFIVEKLILIHILFSEKISSNFYWQDVGIIFIIINMGLILLLWTYFYKSKLIICGILTIEY